LAFLAKLQIINPYYEVHRRVFPNPITNYEQ